MSSKVEQIKNDLNKLLKADVIKLGNDEFFTKGRLNTGSLLLDELIGGYLLGRVVEFYGPMSVGKTSIAYRAVAEAQKKFEEKEVAFVDVEKTFDPNFAKMAGVDIDKLHLVVPEYGDRAIDVMNAMLYTNEYSLIVCDTVAALCTKRELDKTAEEKTMGEQAQLMSRGLRKLTAANNDTLIIFINQVREKIGVLYGSPTTTPGGRALGFYASQRFELVRASLIKMKIPKWSYEKEGFVEEETPVGHVIAVRIKKDKVSGKENSVCYIPFLYNIPELKDIYPGAEVGIDLVGEKIVLGLKNGEYVKSGAWYEVQGKEKKLRKNELRQLIVDQDEEVESD